MIHTPTHPKPKKGEKRTDQTYSEKERRRERRKERKGREENRSERERGGSDAQGGRIADLVKRERGKKSVRFAKRRVLTTHLSSLAVEKPVLNFCKK